MNFSQLSQSITNDMMNPNIETDLSNLTDLRRQSIKRISKHQQP